MHCHRNSTIDAAGAIAGSCATNGAPSQKVTGSVHLISSALCRFQGPLTLPGYGTSTLSASLTPDHQVMGGFGLGSGAGALQLQMIRAQ